MKFTDKEAVKLLDELLKSEPKFVKWRKCGIGITMTKETFDALKASSHPKKDFVLQGVIVERRGKLRY
ncbi:MAG TPA: hypothetical protein VHE12_11355 [bacterium]|nr:hypothetical protein [bacterium]